MEIIADYNYSLFIYFQVSGFNVKGIKFEPGSIGVREVSFEWRKMKDYIRLEIIAGSPAKLLVPGWGGVRVIFCTNYFVFI